MPKRITDGQRIVTYAMNATEEQLQQAIETLRAIQASKFPPVKRTRKTKQVAVADERQAELPNIPATESAN
jgi:hypothetical protein